MGDAQYDQLNIFTCHEKKIDNINSLTLIKKLTRLPDNNCKKKSGLKKSQPSAITRILKEMFVNRNSQHTVDYENTKNEIAISKAHCKKQSETEAATRGVLRKKVFLEISQNSQENTCARVSFLIKLQALGLQLY